jgi:hypothetical protein
MVGLVGTWGKQGFYESGVSAQPYSLESFFGDFPQRLGDSGHLRGVQ